MKKLLTYFIITITSISYGQQDLTLYYMENVPQTLYLNPAFKPKARLNIGLPGISSIYIDHLNTTFTPKNLFESNNGTTTLTLDKLKTEIKDNNYFGINTKIDLLSFGFQVKKSYFSFNITENVFARVNLSRGLLELPLYGNADFDHHNGEIDLSNTGINLTHYREFGVGWQREFFNIISLGAKVKLLSGKSNVWTKTNTFKLETNPDDYEWNISGELDARSSGFDSTSNIMNGDAMKYLFNSANKGIAVDLGGTLKFNDKISLNASILDLGYITWKSNNRNFKTNDASFSFTGLNLTDIVNAPDSVSGDSLDAAITRLEESAKDELGFSENGDSYKKMLTARVYFGGTYQVYKGKNSNGKIGVLFQSEIYNKTIRPSMTLSYNQTLGRWLNASLSYSMINRGFNNIGAGASFNLGPVQFYVTADNLFAAQLTTFKRDGEIAMIYPTNSNKTHVHLGLNITIGRKKKEKKVKKEKDIILEKKEG